MLFQKEYKYLFHKSHPSYVFKKLGLNRNTVHAITDNVYDQKTGLDASEHSGYSALYFPRIFQYFCIRLIVIFHVVPVLKCLRTQALHDGTQEYTFCARGRIGRLKRIKSRLLISQDSPFERAFVDGMYLQTQEESASQL